MLILPEIFNMDVFHRFFFFLGTTKGSLFKLSVELILFTLVTYMLFSEYTRNRKVELKYLMAAFSIFMFQKLALVLIYFFIVYGDLQSEIVNQMIPLLSTGLQIIALVLITNSLIFPIFRNDVSRLNKRISFYLSFFIILGVVYKIVWYIFYLWKGYNIGEFWGTLMFTSIKIFLFALPLYMIAKNNHVKFKYRRNLFLAFFVYMISPLLAFINIILFNNTALRLQVLEHPFPFIGAVLITRVIFLKVVDKAYLKRRVWLSEQKYLHEKELSKLKDDFVSVVSHELRTPITSMKLYLSLLKSKKFGDVNKKQVKTIDTISSECNRLSILINDILDLSKLESGKAKLNLSRFKVLEIKDPLYEAQANEKGVQLIHKIPKDLEVFADKDKIKQSYINLLNNAIKFTTEGGAIFVTAVDLKDRWKLIVEDNGVGMSKEALAKVFDKFYQAEHHMIRTRGGTGLGLTITKKIVDLHRGKIDVESEEGVGSKFIITLPKDVSNYGY